MANQPSGVHGARLSVRAATEPLPSPLPPPPRSSQMPTYAPVFVDVRTVQPVPPPPHFETALQAPAADTTTDAGATVPRRRLGSPGVLLSLAGAAVALLVLWRWDVPALPQLHTPSVTNLVGRWTERDQVPDDELPYITAIPIVLHSGSRPTPVPSQPNSFLLSELVGEEGAEESPPKRARLR